MNNNSRTKNTVLNIITNMGYQCLVIFLTFFSRRLFISNLGVNFLGISSLLSSIINVLALAELGITSAIQFSMYKYIAEDNKEKLKALNTYYKKLYNRIALIVLVIGLLLLPFLQYIVKLEEPIENLELYYIINLINTVSSYLFVYKTTIVNADQKAYRLKAINCVTVIAKFIIQIFILAVYKNYLIYLIATVLFTITNNIIRSKCAEKWYPFIKEKNELDKEEKKEIWSNIKSMFFYKIGGVAMHHTDNILISILVNTTTVGVYSNYNMIFNKIDSFIGIIFSSLVPSIGNLNVNALKEEKYRIYKVLTFVTFWLFAVATIVIFYVGEDIIRAISGSNQYLVANEIFLIGLILFYTTGMCYPNGTFRKTTGLFKMAKYAMFVCAAINVILSIVLGKMFGLFGIILASFISRLLTVSWYEPYLLYKNFFKRSVFEYYKMQLIMLSICVGIILIIFPIIKMINIDNLYIRIFTNTILCFLITNALLFVIYRNSEEFKYLYNKFKDIISKAFKLKKV